MLAQLEGSPPSSRHLPGIPPCGPRMSGTAPGRQPDQQGGLQVPAPGDISDIEFVSTLDEARSQASEHSAAADSADGSADQDSSADEYSKLNSKIAIQLGT